MIRMNLLPRQPNSRRSIRWCLLVGLLLTLAVFGWWRLPALYSYRGPDPSVRLFVFVSQSLPPMYIRDLQTQLGKVTSLPIAFVLRGTTSDKLLPDLRYWSLAPTGAQIPVWLDPLLYRKYQVSLVPTFLLVSGYDPDCPSCPDSHDTQAWMLHGATSADHLLDRLREASGLPQVEAALREARAGFFER